MTTRNALFSAIHFLLVVAVLSIGGGLIALGMVSHVRLSIINTLSENPDLFTLLGFVALGLASLLLYAFYFLNRVCYFQLQMGGKVDPKLIAQLTQGYVAFLFPGASIPTEVHIRSSQVIEVILQLKEPSEELLKKIEKELGELFEKHLKYKGRFILTVGMT